MTEPQHDNDLYEEQVTGEDIFADKTVVEPQEPLGRIALAMSGGGFRAASFSLGTLSYLHRIQYKGRSLLEHVKFITSTSGGTLTNAAYAVKLYKFPEQSFEDFYKEFSEQISGEQLLQHVFTVLGDKHQWTEKGILTCNNEKREIRKQRNFINSFAKVYDARLFKNATLGDISDNFKGRVEKPHLEECCFNTTEFNNGINFYFQVDGHEHKIRPIGNYYLKFSDFAAARKLKVSDIVAGSSCFPGGFEPIVYPNDFVHENAKDVNELLHGISYDHNNPEMLSSVKHKPFSIMDGGITDNMGLSAILRKDKLLRKDEKGFDLILAADVTSFFTNPVVPPQQLKGFVARTISIRVIINFFKFAPVLTLLCLLSMISGTWSKAGYLLLLPSILFSLVYLAGYKLTKPKSKDDPGLLATALSNIEYIYRLPLRDSWSLISARINSVQLLVGDLFLKQIRRGQYSYFFESPTLKERAIASLVYEFSTANKKRRAINLGSRDKGWWPEMEERLKPSEKIIHTADSASSMGTTLWFAGPDSHKKDELIATGQFTTCYNLIKHIKRLQVKHKKFENDTDLVALLNSLLIDWTLFQEDPQFMVKDINAKL